jgi:hypothetical protein
MNKLMIILLALLFTVSCDDIVVKDIEGAQVYLLAPTDNAVLTSGEVTLWWDFVDGASHYELTVASPDFVNVQMVQLDTVIEKNRFEVTLSPGKHEWCVRAINSAYATDLSCRFLEVTQ